MSKSDPSMTPDEEDPNTSYLLSYTRHLERQTRKLETEKQMVEGERLRLQRELNSLRSELERLRSPPLFAGIVIEIIDEDKALVKSSTGPELVVNISSKVDKQHLSPTSRVALNQRSFSIVDVLPANHDPIVRAMEIETKPDIDYGSIGGLDEQLQEVREIVELPLTNPELFDSVGVVPPKGVLLYGPPGTGKTLIARAVAKATNASFIRVIGSELVQKFIGEGARLVREIFEYAKEHSPTILFIDELDAIGSRRLEVATSGDREVQRTLMQLLANMDGFESRGDVKVIAATNRVDILDPALLRPGRFDRLVEIGPPSADGREEIINIHLKGMNVDDTLPMKFLVDNTDGYTGADIQNLVVEAGMFAIRNKRKAIIAEDFLDAIEKLSNKSKKKLQNNNDFM